MLLLLVGLFFAVLGIDFHVNRFRAGPNDAGGYALIFGTIYLLLGLWCIFGAIRNLRNLPGIRQASVRPSESFVRWHLRILVVAVVCEVFGAIAYSRDLIPSSGFKIVQWGHDREFCRHSGDRHRCHGVARKTELSSELLAPPDTCRNARRCPAGR